MDRGLRIRDWEGWVEVREWARRQASMREWGGWRCLSPAAGSLAAHGVVGVAIVSMFGASITPRPTSLAPPSTELQVTLVAETPMPSMRPSTSVRPPAPDAEPMPERPRAVRPRKEEPRSSDPSVDTSDPGAVYLPPSILSGAEIPRGLQGLVNADRCNPKKGLKPEDCGAEWSARIEQPDAWQTASKEDLRQHFVEFMPVCPYRVGCEAGEWISTNGTRSVIDRLAAASGTIYRGSPMNSGAAGLGGIHDLVGRLPFNPDHTDPGFGD